MTDQPSKVVPVNFYSLACECQDWASSAWLANQPTTEPDDEMKADLQKFVDRLYGLFLNLSGEGAAAPHEEAQTPAPQGGGEGESDISSIPVSPAGRHRGGNGPVIFSHTAPAIEHLVMNSPEIGPDYPGHPVGEKRIDCPMCAARPSQSDEGEKT